MFNVSVAMATYNGAAFLKPQLDSLATQTRPPAELIICDDGSSDHTVQIIQAFSKIAPFPVRLYQNEVRLGYRANFMKAANLCESELIAFCDQDDVWAPNKLTCICPIFNSNCVVLAYHNSYIIDESNNKQGLYWSRGDIRILSEGAVPPLLSTAPGFAMVFRRSLLAYSNLWVTSIDPYKNSEPMGHDSWIFFLAPAIGEIVVIEEPLASYRQHGGNVYGFQPKSLLRRIRKTLSRLGKQARASNSKLSVAWYKAQLAAIHNRTEVLNALSKRLDRYDRLNGLTRAYHSLGETLGLRICMYESHKWLDRFYRFLQILCRSGYFRSSKSSLGAHAIIKDFLLVVPFL